MPNRVVPVGDEEENTSNRSFSLMPSSGGSPRKSKGARGSGSFGSLGSMQRSFNESLPLRIETKGKNRPKGISWFEDAHKDEEENDDSEDEEISVRREQTEQLGALEKDSSRLRGKVRLPLLGKEGGLYLDRTESYLPMGRASSPSIGHDRLLVSL